MYPWGDARPYHSYAAYCRRTFGRPIQKLPVDGGFTCPNRDGTVGRGGCTFVLKIFGDRETVCPLLLKIGVSCGIPR